MLFLTQNCHRHDLGSLLARDADDAWTQVKLWGFDPCFIVTYSATTARVSESWVVARLADLRAIAPKPDESGETAKVVVHLMSPWWLNKQGQWQIDELDKVFEGQNPLIPEALLRYQLKNGRLLESDVKRLQPHYDPLKTTWNLVFNGADTECQSNGPK